MPDTQWIVLFVGHTVDGAVQALQKDDYGNLEVFESASEAYEAVRGHLLEDYAEPVEVVL